MVPKPFSRMTLVVGEPVDVDENAGSEELAEKTRELTETFHRLAEEADAAAAG
jgi:lysophospholipid acyltransferase (LPLAT)-like uncharacterized protein